MSLLPIRTDVSVWNIRLNGLIIDSVSQIEPCSIAAEDGHIREGDQILQASVHGQPFSSSRTAIVFLSLGLNTRRPASNKLALDADRLGELDGRSCDLSEIRRKIKWSNLKRLLIKLRSLWIGRITSAPNKTGFAGTLFYTSF